MRQLTIEYDPDNISNFLMKQSGAFNLGELVVVLAHAIGRVTGNEDLEADILRVILERSLNNGQI